MTKSSAKTTCSLAGRRLLVVEDEYFIAEDIRAILERHGAIVIGPVGELAEARDILACEDRIDAAVLDINLHGETVFPLADVLRARGVPFVFATGYSEAAIPSSYGDVPRWEKPYDYDDLVDALPSLVSMA